MAHGNVTMNCSKSTKFAFKKDSFIIKGTYLMNNPKIMIYLKIVFDDLIIKNKLNDLFC